MELDIQLRVLMDADSKDKPWDGKTERRKEGRGRRRLVDLTRMAGTDRREKKGRRKGDQPNDTATERPDKKNKE